METQDEMFIVSTLLFKAPEYLKRNQNKAAGSLKKE